MTTTTLERPLPAPAPGRLARLVRGRAEDPKKKAFQLWLAAWAAAE